MFFFLELFLWILTRNIYVFAFILCITAVIWNTHFWSKRKNDWEHWNFRQIGTSMNTDIFTWPRYHWKREHKPLTSTELQQCCKSSEILFMVTLPLKQYCKSVQIFVMVPLQQYCKWSQIIVIVSLPLKVVRKWAQIFVTVTPTIQVVLQIGKNLRYSHPIHQSSVANRHKSYS